MKKVLILMVVCFLLLNSTAAFADYDDSLYIVGDIALARPFGLAATIIGGAIFIVCLPFSLPSGSVKSTADALVKGPYRFTFERPVGEFSSSSYSTTASERETESQKE